MNLEEFESGKQIPYDIFIRLSDKKYVKVATKGEDLTVERIQGYRARNVTSLYLRKEDFLDYVGFQSEAPAAKEKDDPAARQLSELCTLGNLTLELMFFNEINEVVYGTAKNFVDTTVGLLADDRHALNVLAPLKNQADFVYGHSVGVSVYSVMIARQLGWKSSAAIFRLALGGLLHDIGKRDIDRNILLKPEKSLKPDEMALLREHPERGVKILEKVPSVPSDVLDIVLQHHENVSGQGYPRKLSKVHIHPLARVVAVANGFFNLVLTGPNGPGNSPAEALLKMIASGDYDEEALGALKRMFKVG